MSVLAYFATRTSTDGVSDSPLVLDRGQGPMSALTTAHRSQSLPRHRSPAFISSHHGKLFLSPLSFLRAPVRPQRMINRLVQRGWSFDLRHGGSCFLTDSSPCDASAFFLTPFCMRHLVRLLFSLPAILHSRLRAAFSLNSACKLTGSRPHEDGQEVRARYHREVLQPIDAGLPDEQAYLR